MDTKIPVKTSDIEDNNSCTAYSWRKNGRVDISLNPIESVLQQSKK